MQSALSIPAAFQLLDTIPEKKRGMGAVVCLCPEKKRGMGAVVCLCSEPGVLRENVLALPVRYI